MEVEIISRETLKPSLPTPQHLRTYKLCLFDQLAPPVYVPITLFYSAGDGNHPGKSSDHLKDSLSKILTHYYPFAGRLNDDGLTVDCNDDGAVFVEARVSCELSFVVDEPENEVLERLLPLNPRLHQAQLSAGDGNPVMLGVQINYFACGGVAIGVCISHVIADGAAAAGFLKAWSRFACGSTDTIETESVVYDCGSRFPPQDLSEFYRVTNPIDEKVYVSLSPKEIVSNIFRFDGLKITAIRNEIRDNSSQYYSTRVESVIALIWEALIAASSTTTKNAEPQIQPPITVIGNSVNLRHRMNPPLPQQCIGNVSFLAIVSSFDDKTKNRSSLAKRIRRSVKERDEECKRDSKGIRIWERFSLSAGVDFHFMKLILDGGNLCGLKAG